MLHSKESGDGSYTAKLIASNNDENSLRLQELITGPQALKILPLSLFSQSSDCYMPVKFDSHLL